jgi:hypothetical protein
VADLESRMQDARDIEMEAVMAGVPPLHYLLGDATSSPGVECRGCGCTDWNACVVNGVPCHWVEADLCSACPRGAEPCPECQQGKHLNCDGMSWDMVADDEAPCPCEAAGHGG